MTCQSCGAALPERARFCLECGAEVSATSVREVRKTVTLLFTDVTGSTALGEQLDPEAYRDIMGRYFTVAREAVERHGGTVEKFVGDAVLAVFGVPDVREDDALRAVRAAFEMTSGLAALSTVLEGTLGVCLEVRTGVNTGSVVAGASRAGGSFATGDAVNTAARLEQVAEPGTILIGEETYALVRDSVEVDAVAPVAVKGKAAPVVAYLLREVHEPLRGRERRQATRLIGRDREARALVEVLERTLETGRGHLVTVVGGPGIGKTRLVSDFIDHVGDRAEVITSRCVSYGQGITFWPIVQLLRQALRLTGGESEEVARHALAQLMEGSPDADQVAGLLLALLGKSADPGGNEQTIWAVRRALEQLASRGPLVVTVDDLHWAEPNLLRLIERVRDEVRDLPLLMVCQTRPELLDENPNWGGGSLNSTTFGLEPFSRQQTTDSLAALLGGEVDDSTGAIVSEWAGGNPLFVEEVAAHLVDRGLLRLGSSGWDLLGDLAEAQVPPTVAALLAARLGRLPERERHLAERLSVVGLEVTADDAVYLADGEIPAAEVPAALAALTHGDLLHRRRTALGEVWVFRHILVRDAAYESLPKALRAELHERFADRIDDLGDQVGAERVAFMAHHLEQALLYRRELARHDPRLVELAERTGVTLIEAAAEARDREDLPVAERMLRRAAEIAPTPMLRRRALVWLFQVMADDERVSDEEDVAEQLAEALDETATELDRLAVEMLRGTAALSRADPIDPAGVGETAARCAEMAARVGDTRLQVLALLSVSLPFMIAARWAETEKVFKQVGALGRPADRRWAQLFAAATILYGPAPLSDLRGHVAHTRAHGQLSPSQEEGLDLTEAMADAAAGSMVVISEVEKKGKFPEIYREVLLGVVCALRGDTDGAIAHFDATVRMMGAAGDNSHLSTQAAWVGVLRLEQGDSVELGLEMVERAASVTSPYDVISVSLVAAGRGLAAARRGDHGPARAFFDEAVRLTDTTDQVWQQADVRRWAALAAQMAGDSERTRRLLTEARDRYESKAIVHWVGWCDEHLSERPMRS